MSEPTDSQSHAAPYGTIAAESESGTLRMHRNQLELITGGAPPLRTETSGQLIRIGSASLYNGDAMDMYDRWLPPTCIIADGPYGLGKFLGEPKSPDGLAEWYAPHAAAWARRAQPFTTLWFWNSEIGWAKSHSALELHGWQYEETVIWDKGIAHIAGNCTRRQYAVCPWLQNLL